MGTLHPGQIGHLHPVAMAGEDVEVGRHGQGVFKVVALLLEATDFYPSLGQAFYLGYERQHWRPRRTQPSRLGRAQ